MRNLPGFTRWKHYFESTYFSEDLKKIYGTNPSLIQERQEAYLSVLNGHHHFVPEQQPLFIVRVPARINLMGVHIEHRGGCINCMTIAKELLMAVAPRPDALVRFANLDAQYSPFEFTLDSEFSPHHQVDWLDYINTVSIQPGNWENYVKAAGYYLQNHAAQSLRGMDVTVWGQIPPAAGLSSSSALVVGTMEALDLINQLRLTKAQKTIMGGEAEWYVGTRGGAGDHGAIIHGLKNHIVHLQFFPLRVKMIPLPPHIAIVACHSLIEAKKSGEAKDHYNTRIAAYEIAFSMLKQRFPEFTGVNHLRDYNTRHLQIELEQLYRMIQTLPMKMTRTAVLRTLPTETARFKHIFSTHCEPEDGYPIRAVCLFGLSECARSEVTAELLREQKFEELGKLMYISHDGDRRFIHDAQGHAHPYLKNFDAAYFEQLIKNSASKNTERKEAAQLACQPGGYDCSTREMDLIVDLAKTVSGVYGAGLTGAGLGGMVLVLIKKENIPDLLAKLEKEYYHPRNLPLSAEECLSVNGVSIWDSIPIAAAYHTTNQALAYK